MSRVNYVDRLAAEQRAETQGALYFKYWNLTCPRIEWIFSSEEIEQLRKLATSAKYANKVKYKNDVINSIMYPKGFYRAHAGTNRIVYESYRDKSFVVKIAIDKIGMKDAPAEYINQFYLQPFCARVFQYAGDGVISFNERVFPVTCIEEFESIREDIVNMMYYKLYKKHLVCDDLSADRFMNYGVRYSTTGATFGPVVLDYPCMYKVDIDKTICPECGGDINYNSLLHFKCKTCGKKYSAADLGTALELPTDFNNIFNNNDEGEKERKNMERVVCHYNDGKKNKHRSNYYDMYPIRESRIVDSDGNIVVRNVEGCSPAKPHKNIYVWQRYADEDMRLHNAMVKNGIIIEDTITYARDRNPQQLEMLRMYNMAQKEKERIINEMYPDEEITVTPDQIVDADGTVLYEHPDVKAVNNIVDLIMRMNE